MKYLSAIALSAAMLCSAASAMAADAREAFLSAPARVIPLLPNNTRLDMLDYFNSGLSSASSNSMKGQSRILALSDQAISIQLTEASQLDIATLPAGSDTLIAVINTVATPAPDSKLTIFTPGWKSDITATAFTRPAVKDWLTAEGKKNAQDVESLVPFMLINYSYDPASATLTLTNNTASFMSDDIYSLVADYLKPQLTYKWNGRKFVAQK